MSFTVVDSICSWLKVYTNRVQIKEWLDDNNVDQESATDVLEFISDHDEEVVDILSRNASMYTHKLMFHFAFDHLLKQFYKSNKIDHFDLDEVDDIEVEIIFDEQYEKLKNAKHKTIKKAKKILGTIELMKIIEYKKTEKHGPEKAYKKIAKYFRRKLEEEYPGDYSNGGSFLDDTIEIASTVKTLTDPVSLGLKVLKSLRGK